MFRIEWFKFAGILGLLLSMVFHGVGGFQEYDAGLARLGFGYSQLGRVLGN